MIVKGKVWDDWFEEIEWEFRYFKIMELFDKKDVFIIYGGKEIVCLEKSLLNLIDGVNDYEKLRKKLNDYFKLKKNKYYVRYVFFKMRLIYDEIMNVYVVCLREKVNDCEFEVNCDE